MHFGDILETKIGFSRLVRVFFEILNFSDLFRNPFGSGFSLIKSINSNTIKTRSIQYLSRFQKDFIRSGTVRIGLFS